eukprot:CAMPEP_0184486282 /NCGR_PEP_ID=MMETSP0113_2-20130426/7794_1 /TAXON_ID=91329 /ORGANISM="Norrisiella sphaerica, Strain BC52" /LENGTH=356 /DNA_ID=CAMNT_0026868081 /DNA_START=274 /DNA_END=1344 /DNA_ORIENTATION=+
MPAYVLEFYKLTPEDLRLPLEQRRKVLAAKMKPAGEDGKFPENSLTETADISLLEELMVVSFFCLILGGPPTAFFSGIYLLLFGTWTSLAVYGICMVVLAFHPLPKFYEGIIQSKFSLAIYKYFSFRMIMEDTEIANPDADAWVGASPPHGVLPIANVLSMLGINLFARPFVGGGASVVLNAPFLRYMSLFGGMVSVSASSIDKATTKGLCVGLCPDGIAGMFRTSDENEVVYLRNRMGLAKFALRTGKAIIPAYSIGNTKIFTPWFDPYGIMEFLSRRMQASILVFWGKWFLPVPHRYNITMLCGKPLREGKLEEKAITPERIKATHQRILDGITDIFDRHKAAVGWGETKIIFI